MPIDQLFEQVKKIIRRFCSSLSRFSIMLLTILVHQLVFCHSLMYVYIFEQTSMLTIEIDLIFVQFRKLLFIVFVDVFDPNMFSQERFPIKIKHPVKKDYFVRCSTSINLLDCIH